MVEAKPRAHSSINELTLTAELARLVASSAGLEGVLRAAADLIALRLPADRITVYVLDAERSSFAVREVSSNGSGFVVRIRPPITGAAAEEMRQMLAGGVESRFKNGVLQVELVASGEVVGALEIAGHEVPLGEQERRLLSLAADQISSCVRQERLSDQLERKQRDLADTKQHLARSRWLESLGQLVAGTAHEFNNVISAILGRAQLLRRTVASPEVLRSLDVIEQAAMDGSGLVKRIRDRLQDAGPTHTRPVQLNMLVRETVERAATRIEGRIGGGPISLEIEPRPARPVLAHATELRQVLTNLIYNAVDAMPQGGRLVVRTGSTPEKNEVWFEVEDEGSGMDEETRARVFEPFFTTKGSNGTGLGLSVSHEIIARHGGRFEVESAPQCGTRFRAVLPAHLGSDLFITPRHGMEAIRIAEHVRPEVAPKPEKPAILVIDDDVAVLDVLSEMLRTADYQVVKAASGEEGLALFQASSFDLVFTDLGMPSMNGWEVVAAIKAQSPSTPIGVITGWEATVDRDRLHQLGVDLILAKPFRYQQVVELVERALARPVNG